MNKIKWREMLVVGIEWFARLAILNLCWLLFSIPLFTFIPASAAGYAVLKRWSDGEELDQPVLSLYKNQFVERFRESYLLGLPFIGVGVILIINLIFFFTAEYESSGFLILKYATIVLAGLHLFIFSYSFALATLHEAKTLTLIKLSFVVMLSQPQRLIQLFFAIIVASIIFTLFPALLFFFSITVIAYQFLKATEAGYSNLLAEQKNL